MKGIVIGVSGRFGPDAPRQVLSSCRLAAACSVAYQLAAQCIWCDLVIVTSSI
jgi:hypothetical protein